MDTTLTTGTDEAAVALAGAIASVARKHSIPADAAGPLTYNGYSTTMTGIAGEYLAALRADPAAARAVRDAIDPHSGACCEFDDAGHMTVTQESCKCGPIEREARAALAASDEAVRP